MTVMAQTVPTLCTVVLEHLAEDLATYQAQSRCLIIIDGWKEGRKEKREKGTREEKLIRRGFWYEEKRLKLIGK